jgi:hypothetical protein
LRKRGQVVKLRNIETGKIVEGKVIQHDSIQGYWVEEKVSSNFLNDWKWYPPDQWTEL